MTGSRDRAALIEISAWAPTEKVGYANGVAAIKTIAREALAQSDPYAELAEALRLAERSLAFFCEGKAAVSLDHQRLAQVRAALAKVHA